jgi:hypothetical protein
MFTAGKVASMAEYPALFQSINSLLNKLLKKAGYSLSEVLISVIL